MLHRKDNHHRIQESLQRKQKPDLQAYKKVVNIIRKKEGLAPTGDPEYLLHVIPAIKALRHKRHTNKLTRKLAALSERVKKNLSHEASKNKQVK